MFSGLNLAFFGLSRLQLEVEAETSARASRVLAMRQDSNFLLTTILETHLKAFLCRPWCLFMIDCAMFYTEAGYIF